MLEKMVKDYLDADNKVSMMELSLKDAKERRDRFEKQVIEQMDNEGIESFKTDDGSFSLMETLYASVDKKDFGVAKEFLNEKGLLAEMIEEVIRKGRLNTLVKDMMKSSEPIPEFFTYYIRRYISKR